MGPAALGRVVEQTERAASWKAQTQKSFGGEMFLLKEQVSQYERPMDRIQNALLTRPTDKLTDGSSLLLMRVLRRRT